MKNEYIVRLLKGQSVTELEMKMNELIGIMSEKGYNLKDIKYTPYDRYAGYLFILVFYKIK